MKTLIVILALALAVVLFWACPVQAFDTVDAQRALNALGYNVGTADGKMGPRTIQGIKKFQKSKDILETGKLNKVTRDALAGLTSPFERSEDVKRKFCVRRPESILCREQDDAELKDGTEAAGKVYAERFERQWAKRAATRRFPTWPAKGKEDISWDGLFWILIILVIYFTPTIDAVAKRHLRWEAIFWLNFLLGWLFIPWVIALCWAHCPPFKPAEEAAS